MALHQLSSTQECSTFGWSQYELPVRARHRNIASADDPLTVRSGEWLGLAARMRGCQTARMATKKKTKKKPTKSKRTAGKKVTLVKGLAKKGRIPKKLTKKRPAPKKAAPKRKAVGKKTTGGKTMGAVKKQTHEKSRHADAGAFSREESRSRSGDQSGDSQGLSNAPGADSESVGELLEEGNAFEAEVVTGVEEAGDIGERAVRTHEVPEDDVPAEYLDKE